MQRTRFVGPLGFALACALALVSAFATAGVSSTAPRPMPSPSPSPNLGPSTTDCSQPQQFGELTLCTNESTYNFKTGDLQFPKALHGRTPDGTYQADRGYGNLHSELINLVGHVVIHRDASRDKAGKPVAAMTLVADQAHMETKAKYYRASGNVKITQNDLTLLAPLVIDDEAHRMMTASGGVTILKGDKKLTAPQATLDETTHIATLTGGVHAEEKPDRSFDAAEVIYNTSTEDFKALGGVRVAFPPATTPATIPAPTPKTPTPKATAPRSPAPKPSPTATP
jgi:lipopolysaccharide assembly outer membrane protein LptD (OstA)